MAKKFGLKSMISINVKLIGAILAILVTISSFGTWVYNYHSGLASKTQIVGLATKVEVNSSNLDTQISNSETKVLIYQLVGLEKLSEADKDRYQRARAKLINLEAERGKVSSNEN